MEAIAATIALIIGVVLAGAFIPAFFRSFSTLRWVRTPGVVTASSIETRTESDGTHSYAPLVTYRYEYRGRSHIGNSLSLVGTSKRYRKHADEVVRAYSSGARVTVYVDGSAPSRSVLKAGVEWFAGIAVCFGLGIAGFAISVLSKL
jgi:hypothetical protein